LDAEDHLMKGFAEKTLDLLNTHADEELSITFPKELKLPAQAIMVQTGLESDFIAKIDLSNVKKNLDLEINYMEGHNDFMREGKSIFINKQLKRLLTIKTDEHLKKILGLKDAQIEQFKIKVDSMGVSIAEFLQNFVAAEVYRGLLHELTETELERYIQDQNPKLMGIIQNWKEHGLKGLALKSVFESIEGVALYLMKDAPPIDGLSPFKWLEEGYMFLFDHDLRDEVERLKPTENPSSPEEQFLTYADFVKDLSSKTSKQDFLNGAQQNSILMHSA